MKNKLRKIMAYILVLTLVGADIAAIAEEIIHTLTLPKALQIIEEEAFYGDTSIGKVVVPDGTMEIRSRAFAGSSLTEIELPDSLSFIADDAFEGCEDLSVSVPENCYAYDWALSKGYIASAGLNLRNIEVEYGEITLIDGEVYWEKVPGYWESSDILGIEASDEWILVSNSDWILVNCYTYNNSTDKIWCASFRENHTGSNRMGTIDVICGDITKTITVTQLPYPEARLLSPEVLARDGVYEEYYDEDLGDYVDAKQDNYPVLPFEDLATTWQALDQSGSYELYYEPLNSSCGDRCIDVQNDPSVSDTFTVTIPKKYLEVGSTTPALLYTLFYDEESGNGFGGTRYAFYISSEGLNGYSAYYDLDDETEAEDIVGTVISGYSGDETELIIPNVLLDYPVTAIGANAFNGNAHITSVIISDSVTRINWNAFAYCTNLTSITIPESVEWIDDEAFSDCTNLEHFYVIEGSYAYDWALKHSILPEITVTPTPIPEPSEITENGVVYYLDNGTATVTDYVGNDTSVEIPAQVRRFPVTEIGDNAFEACDSLISISIPDGVTRIGDGAFGYCNSLMCVELPSTLKTIGDGVFNYCPFTVITLPEGIEMIGSGAFTCCDLTTINLPASLTYIADNAFVGCPLTRVTVEAGTYAYDWAARIGFVGNNTAPVSDFEYQLNVDGTSTLTGYLGNAQVVILPFEFEGHPLTMIGEKAFKDSDITILTIPEGVTSIGSSAFRGCTSLVSVRIPDGVTSIGEYAFYGCSNLTSIRIPDGVSSINYAAFYDCSSLTSIRIPDSVTNISSEAFANCSSLIGIEIPDDVTRIGASVFAGCKSLTSIKIPDGVTRIVWYTFYGCSNLTSIRIPDSVSDIDQYAFYGCSSLTSIRIPDGVPSIDESTFRGCSSLINIEIPDSVTSIGENAFYDCSSLTSIEIPDGVTSIGFQTFCGCSSLISVIIPDGMISIGKSAFEGCSGLTSISIPDGVTSIGENAFCHCSSLTSIEIPDGVTSIGYRTFSGCSSLISVIIPDGVISIKRYAFYVCVSLNTIEIPDGMISIDQNAFEGCSSLTSIRIPDSVTYIGSTAFASCSSLIDIEIPDGVTSISAGVFSDCSNLTSVKIPDGVTSIGESAFSGCSSLTSIKIPDGVISIGGAAFSGCSSLSSIKIPDCVTGIGSYAFSNCSSLTSIKIPGGVASIANSVFFFCMSLTSIEIPDSVTRIGEHAFNNCKSLTSIRIPDGVGKIGQYAFYGCSSLTSVYIPDCVTSIGTKAFSNCSSDLIIYGESGSYAEEYAEANDIAFVDGTMPGRSTRLSGRIISEDSDTGVPGIIVMVYNAQDQTLVGTTMSDSNGAWQKSGLLRGQGYRVKYHASNYVLSSEEVTIAANYASNVLPIVTAVLKEDAASMADLVVNCTVSEVEAGVPVVFDIAVSNANQVRLIADGIVYETYNCGDQGGKIERAFTKAGDRLIQFQAGMNNEWGAICDPIAIKVTNEKGELGSAQVYIDECCQAFEDAYVSWDAVENAEMYTVYVFVNGVDVYRYALKDTATTIPGDVLRYPGNYAVEVIATAIGYTQSSGSAEFIIVDKALSLSSSCTHTFVGATVNIEVEAPAADYLRITTSKPNKTRDETKLIYDTSASLVWVADCEGCLTVRVEAMKDGEVYAEDSLAIEVSGMLSLSQYSWKVLNAEESLRVQVEAESDWEIAYASSWLNAVKDEDEVVIAVNADSVEGKTGYVDIICGNAQAVIEVIGGEDDLAVNITNPDSSLVSNGEDLQVTWAAVESAAEYALMLYNATEKSYSIIENEAVQAKGYAIPAELLVNGHTYILTVIARMYSDEGAYYREIRTEKQFTVETADRTSLSGCVKDRNGQPISGAVVYAFAEGIYLTSANTDAQGKWCINGLALRGSYRFIANYCDYSTNEIETILNQNSIELEDLVFAHSESDEPNIIDIEEDSVYSLEFSSSVKSIVASETWLKYEIQIEEDKTLLNIWVDTANQESAEAELTVTFENGAQEVYQVYRNIIVKVNNEYLAKEEVTALNYAFVPEGKLYKTYYSNGDGEILGILKNPGKTIINAGDTLRVSGEGAMLINGDLEIKGELILESSSMVRLEVKGNVIVTGKLVVDDCSVNIGKSLKLKGTMSVSSSSKNIHGSYSSAFDRMVMVGNELRLESSACLTLDNGSIEVDGAMNVLDSSQLIMDGDGTLGSAISIYKKATFNSTTDSILSNGEIYASNDVALMDGYVATSKNHTLRLGATRLFFKAKLEFVNGNGQKIGRLYLHEIKFPYLIQQNETQIAV